MNFSQPASSYEQMKDFGKAYSLKGAYHLDAQGFQRWWLEDNYRELARRIQPEWRVLDLACGDGAFSRFCTCELVGVDNSTTALDLLRERMGDRYQDLWLGDMRRLDRLPLAPGSFDAIVCSLSLMYLLEEDLRACVRQVRQLLKREGFFEISYPGVHAQRGPNPTAAELPYDRLTRLVEEEGFRVDEAVGICKVLPEATVAESLVPERSSFARAEYDRMRAGAHEDPANSYHFVLHLARVP